MSDLILTTNSNITAIADAIRNKTGNTDMFSINSMIDEINSFSQSTVDLDLDEEINTQDDIIEQIQTALNGKTANSGIDTSDATATSEDIANGKTAYVNGNKITGTHECEEGIDTSDATAIASDIVNGKTAYVDGIKLVGTHECSSGESAGSFDTCTLSFWHDLMSGMTKIRFIVSTWDSAKNQVVLSDTGNMNNLDNEVRANVICGSLAIVIPTDGTFSTSHNFYIGDDVTESPIATTYHYFTVPNTPNTEINISYGL